MLPLIRQLQFSFPHLLHMKQPATYLQKGCAYNGRSQSESMVS